MPKIKLFYSKGGKDTYIFFCPACQRIHVFNNLKWNFDGNYSHPTVSPSILVTAPYKDFDLRCHSYITGGKIQFQDDCSHGMRNMEVELPELFDQV